MKVEAATKDDHDDICQVAKMSRYTKGAANPHYLSDGAYERGWVGIVRTKQGHIAGFVVVRHLTRDTYTSLYYVGTDPLWRERGVGAALVAWALDTSPHGEVRLICEKSNKETVSWYRTHGFSLDGDGKNKSGDPYWRLSIRTGEWK